MLVDIPSSFKECGCGGNATCDACDGITGDCECMPGYYGRTCEDGKYILKKYEQSFKSDIMATFYHFRMHPMQQRPYTIMFWIK